MKGMSGTHPVHLVVVLRVVLVHFTLLGVLEVPVGKAALIGVYKGKQGAAIVERLRVPVSWSRKMRTNWQLILCLEQGSKSTPLQCPGSPSTPCMHR